jgi:hypothetical protein
MPNNHARLLPFVRRGLALAAGLLIVACNSSAPTPSALPTIGPTAPPTTQPSTGPTTQPSTNPTTGPSTQPTTGPTTGPSIQPSTEPSGEPSSSPVPIGKVDHPTGPTDIVLRLDFAGGFINPAGNLLKAPPFTLYGDNTAIFRPTTDPTGSGMPPFQVAHLSVGQVDALLTYALVRDHLQDADATYPGNPDAGSTIFSVEAGGMKKQVSVFGLNPTPKGPNAAILKGLEDLATTLSDFESQVNAGKVESVEPYQPQMYRAILSEGAADASIPWPWTDLTLDDFSVNPDSGQLMGELTADQAAKVVTLPSGGASDMGVTGPDGKGYLLSLRPVLPGEIF